MERKSIEKPLFGRIPDYGITKTGDFRYKIFNFSRKSTYIVEKKDKFFARSRKTHKIWQCTCPSYQKWAWKTHSCKHIDMLFEIKVLK